MAMVVVDDSCLQADSQPKSGGLVWGSAAAWRCSTFIKWTEWTLTMTFSGHDDSTINIVLGLLLLLLVQYRCYLLTDILPPRFSGHFSRWTYVNRMMEMVTTTGAIRRAKLQTALPVAQPTVSKHWKEKYHIPWTCKPPTLYVTNEGSWLSCLSSVLWCHIFRARALSDPFVWRLSVCHVRNIGPTSRT